jgi:preprotein translocase subunit SecG
MFFGIIIFIFVVVCILLCLLILIQSDKGGGISGAIGGGLQGASSMFGTQDTANVLTKLTTGFAIGFMGLCIIMSLFLSHPSGKQTKSLLRDRAEKQQNFSPASALQQGQGLPLAPINGAQGGAATATQSQGSEQQAAPANSTPVTGGLPIQQTPANAPSGAGK